MGRVLHASALAIALCSGMPSVALAGSHLWRFSEFYSSPDRSVQFIEMQEVGGSNDETRIEDHWYQTDTYNLDHSELLGSPLPFGTANKKFLVGTQSYAALPGVPAPDYVLPDGFLNPDGDTVVWWFYQTLTIPSGVMPSDGTLSVSLADPANTASPTFVVGVNSPTNYAGASGTVELAGAPLLPGWALVALAAGLLLGGWLALRGAAQPAASAKRST